MNSIAPLEAQFARAAALLQQGELSEAETACRALLLSAPRNPATTHLLGLIRKQAGDVLEGERLLRESIALEPRESEFRSNLANLLRRTGRHPEAAASYREALALDPRNRTARVGLARTLNDLSEHAAAEAQARTLIADNARDPTAWSALAMTLRDQLKLVEAEAAYREALALAPTDARVHYNLGLVHTGMDRAEEALAALNRAEALGLRGAELASARGIALLQLYQADAAEAAFDQAVQLNPLHAEAQLNLARVRFMRGDENFSRSIAAAAAAHRGNAELQILLSQILRRAGDLAAAEGLLRDLAVRNGSTPDVHAALAEILLESGRLKEAEHEAAEAAIGKPQDAGVVDVLVTILLSRGRPDDALPFIRAQRAKQPDAQGWIAYEATAARLLGDPLYAQLYDYERFIQVYDLESPPGWTSMAELNAAVLEALNRRHRFLNHPLDQSLRNGSQTARNLLMDADPAIRALMNVFAQPLEDYLHRIGSTQNHPLTGRNAGGAAITAAWSVQLRREGFHVNHVHPRGWISSAYYVATPTEIEDATLQSGWLKFGEPRYPAPGAGPEGAVQPRAGRLVLFPSYMWHGTNPIHGAQSRTTVAFDAVPAPGATQRE